MKHTPPIQRKLTSLEIEKSRVVQRDHSSLTALSPAVGTTLDLSPNRSSTEPRGCIIPYLYPKRSPCRSLKLDFLLRCTEYLIRTLACIGLPSFNDAQFTLLEQESTVLL